MKANQPKAGTAQATQPTAKPTTPTPDPKTKPARPLKKVRIGKGSCGICD